MRNRIIYLVITILIYSSSSLNAWFSMPSATSTHHYLSSDVMNQIDINEYADIAKYQDDIIGWTANIWDDINAHGGEGKDNQGFPKEWWEYAIQRYEKLDYNGTWSSYYYIALLTHLTEDMAVPAHSYDIQHANWEWEFNWDFPYIADLNLDGVERYASKYYTPSDGY